MKNHNYILSGFLLLLLLPLRITAQEFTAKRYIDTIRYEIKYGRIIIPVTVNQMQCKYILDTGGQTATIWEEAKTMGGKLTGANKVTADMNGKDWQPSDTARTHYYCFAQHQRLSRFRSGRHLGRRCFQRCGDVFSKFKP